MPRQTSTAQRLRTGPSRSDRASSQCPSTLTGENIRQAQRGQPPKDFGTRPLTGAGASGGAVSGPPEGTQQWPRMTNDDHSAVAAFRPGPAKTQAARFGIKTQGKPFSSPPSRNPALDLRMSSGGIGSTGEAREHTAPSEIYNVSTNETRAARRKRHTVSPSMNTSGNPRVITLPSLFPSPRDSSFLLINSRATKSLFRLPTKETSRAWTGI